MEEVKVFIDDVSRKRRNMLELINSRSRLHHRAVSRNQPCFCTEVKNGVNKTLLFKAASKRIKYKFSEVSAGLARSVKEAWMGGVTVCFHGPGGSVSVT